jgi:drug/metabolite transporter (DMT)-like permease
VPAAPDRRARPIAALAFLVLVWGYNWVVIKLAVLDASPFTFAATRTLGGGIVLALAAPVLRKSLRPQFPAAYFWIGLFQTAGFIGLSTWAVVTAQAGQVAILVYTMPLWVSLLAWPLLGERIGGWQAAAIAIAFAGVVCMFGPLHSVGVAEWLAVAAGLAWAIGIVLTKRLQQRAKPDVYGLSMWQMLFGGLVLVVVALVVPGHATTWSARYVFAVAYNVVLATAIAYVVFVFVIDALPARDAGMGSLGTPIIGTLAAWLQLGEVPTRLSALGMALIVMGLVVLSIADRRATR